MRTYNETTIDAVGNRVWQDYNVSGPVITSFAYNASNAVTYIYATGSSNLLTTYAYDAAGNRTAENAAGALTTYTWDYENRMTGIELPAGSLVTMTYLPNDRILWLSDVHNNLTTLTCDISAANVLRRDVGGTTPAVEHYTQPPDDFAGLLAQYSTATAQRQFFFSDMSQNIGAVANGSTVNEYHFFQAFG